LQAPGRRGGHGTALVQLRPGLRAQIAGTRAGFTGTAGGSQCQPSATACHGSGGSSIYPWVVAAALHPPAAPVALPWVGGFSVEFTKALNLPWIFPDFPKPTDFPRDFLSRRFHIQLQLHATVMSTAYIWKAMAYS
jgi:hypothetical protein